MNVKKIKADFPFFGKKGAPKEYIFLDNASTTHKPQAVLDSILDFYKNHNSNVFRGVYDLGEQATKMYEQSRDKITKFLNASDSSEIVFTSGTTEGINFIADSWARRHLKAGDEILISEAEHHSNFLPWQRLEKELGIVLKFLPLNTDEFIIGCADPSHFKEEMDFELQGKICVKPDCNFLKKHITKNTKLVAITAYSNLIGPLWDMQNNELEKFIEFAQSMGSKVLVDAAQLAPHFRIDLKKLKPDFLVFSGHKILAPMGTGVLYINKKLHDEVEPYKVGGSMVYSASREESIWKKAPHKFEAGTPNVAGVIGLGAAIDYISSFKNSELVAHETSLIGALIDGLEQIDGVSIYGNIERLKKFGHLLTFSIDGIHPHDLATYLDKYAIAIRAGHHCAQPLSNLLGAESSLRVSVYLYNSIEDINILLDEINNATTTLK